MFHERHPDKLLIYAKNTILLTPSTKALQALINTYKYIRAKLDMIWKKTKNVGSLHAKVIKNIYRISWYL